LRRVRLALESLVGDTGLRVAAIIPTLNEEDAIAGVIAAIPDGAVDRVIVVDSNSSDRTVERAKRAGAEVVSETRKGYGRACRAGAEAAVNCEILVFLDGDGADRPELIPELIAPIAEDRADFVIGSRTRGVREPGSMSAHQLLAGYAIGAALGLLYGVRYTDMGPMRTIRRDLLFSLGMREMTYGWNLEMQMRAARLGLRVVELPVMHCRRVAGVSKVSGNLAGSLKASWRILLTFLRIAAEARRSTQVAVPVRR
jgi:glycosyltransferase involved in cell wall biosynthesis